MLKTIYKKIVSERSRIEIRNTLNKVYGITLRGHNVHCVCCNTSFKKFLPKGNGNESRENAFCPNCGSLERTRLLYMYLKNETTLLNSEYHIFHVSPEKSLLKHLISNPNYVDVDLNPNYARYQEDITHIQKESDIFDYIICSHVLGHIKQEAKAIDELYRILKPNGVAFILTLLNPNDTTYEDGNIISPSQRTVAYGEMDLERLHGNDFEKRLARENITVEKIDYRINFSQEERIKYALGDGTRELIFKCTKN